MNLGTGEAIVAFALAAVPGAIVLEFVEYGRPPLRARAGPRAFAWYLIFSAAAWATGILVLNVDGGLARVIQPGMRDGSLLISAYLGVAWRLALAGAITGLVLRLVLAGVNRLGYQALQKAQSASGGWLHRAARILTGFVSATYAWDQLLARLRRRERAQIVHVRLRDGADLYGVFADSGRADYHADGRGLLLDAELVEREGKLVEVPESSGLFVASDAVASVSFISHTESPDLPVESDHRE